MAVKRKVQEKTNEVVLDLKKTAKSYETVVQEVIKQYRDITIGRVSDEGKAEDKTIRIRFPTLQAEEEAASIYNRVFGELLEDPKRKTEDEILRMMGERGVWTEAQEDRMEAVREKVVWLTEQLLYHTDRMTKPELERLSEQYKEMKKELDSLSTKKYSYTQSSIEGRANEARLKAQVVRSTFYVDSDGNETPVWETDEQLAKEKDRILSNRVFSECMTFWNGVPSTFLDALPDKSSGKSDFPSQKTQDSPSSQSQSASGEEQEQNS